jgi:hypothetical protein
MHPRHPADASNELERPHEQRDPAGKRVDHQERELEWHSGPKADAVLRDGRVQQQVRSHGAHDDGHGQHGHHGDSAPMPLMVREAGHRRDDGGSRIVFAACGGGSTAGWNGGGHRHLPLRTEGPWSAPHRTSCGAPILPSTQQAASGNIETC